MKKNLWILAGVVILLAISIKYFPYHCNCTARHQVTIGSNKINVDISDTPALREQGLSGRSSLPEGQGMLFVFQTQGQVGFWMKDMNFPIDIVWINAQKQIVGAEESVPPSSYPSIFYPKEPILYVLELPAGYVAKHSIDTGTQVNFTP